MFKFFSDAKTTKARAIDLRNEVPNSDGWSAHGASNSQQYYEHIAPYHLHPEKTIQNWHPTLLACYRPPLHVPFAEVLVGRHIRHVMGIPRENHDLYQRYTLALLREIDPCPTEHLEKRKIYLDIEDDHIVYSVIDPYGKVQNGIITQKDLRDSKIPTAEEGLKGFENIKDAILAVTTFREHTLPIYDFIEPRSGVPGWLGWVTYNYYVGSIMLVARPGMEEAATKIIEDAMGRDANLHLAYLPNKTYDLRKRWGFTSNVWVHTERPYFKAVIDFINILYPMDKEMSGEVTKILSHMSYNQRGEIPERIKNIKPNQYFPYSSGDSIRYYFCNYLHFRPEEHLNIKSEIPPIHQAMLNHDYEEVDRLLSENPQNVNVLDNRGFEAHELAYLLRSHKMVERCVSVRDSIGFNHDVDAERQRFYKERLDRPFKSSRPKGNMWLNPGNKEKQQYKIDKYLKIPTLKPRSSLHKACVGGHQTIVKAILKIEPHRINEPDSLGFTPLILAIISDNVDLVSWLIQAGAKIFRGTFREKDIYLTTHAKSASMMELLLFYGCIPDNVSHRLISAIDTFDFKMVKILLRHLTVLPASRGLNAVEYGILACQSGDKESYKILKLLLQHYPNYVAEGPYDHYIPQQTISIIEEHNKSLTKTHKIRAQRPKFSSGGYSFETQEIVEEFSYMGEKVISLILPLDVLINSTELKMHELKENVLQICVRTFKLHNIPDNKSEHSEDKTQAYYSENLHHFLEGTQSDLELRLHLEAEELRSTPGDKKYINLFFVDNTLASFVAFQLKDSEHSHCKTFSLFYVMLAANHPNYAHYGLTKLSFRIPAGLSLLEKERWRRRADYTERKYFTLMETLAPGYALCYLPTFVKFYPKVSMDKEFLKHVKDMVNITSEGKSLSVKFGVKNDRFPEKLSPFLQFHQDMMLKTQEELKQDNKAILVLMENDKDVVERYVSEFQHYGVNRDQLLKLGEDFSWSREQEFWPGLRARM